MMDLVRDRLVDNRRQGFLHELMQLVAKYLRKADAQPEPSADTDFGRTTLAVYHRLCQRHVDNAVDLSRLNEKAGDHRGNPIIYDDPAYAVYLKRLSASKNNFLGH